jgi:carbon-monoxide dehydrogenase medium subunit
VGALVRHRALEGAPEPGPLGRLLARVAPRVGHPPIRNRGTVCGSLAHADPAAEWCLVGLAAGAEVGLASAAGSRRLTVDALLDSPFATDRRPDELITEVTFPRWAPAEVGCGFVERARTAGSFAQAAACVVVRWAGPGAGADDVVAVRIAVAGFGGRPVLLPGAAAALVGRPLTGGQSAAAAAAAAAEITPRDGAGPAGHQRAVVAALVADALDRSARDRGGPDRTDLNGAGRPRLDLAG